MRMKLHSVSPKKYNGEQVSFYSGLPVADYVDLYRDSDLFLCPLTDATACNGLNEAMASGLPILTTNVGDVKWYVDESEGVIIFENRDWRGMAEWFLDNRPFLDLLQKMGASSRIRAETFLDWSVIAPQYTHFFNTVRV